MNLSKCSQCVLAYNNCRSHTMFQPHNAHKMQSGLSHGIRFNPSQLLCWPNICIINSHKDLYTHNLHIHTYNVVHSPYNARPSLSSLHYTWLPFTGENFSIIGNPLRSAKFWFRLKHWIVVGSNKFWCGIGHDTMVFRCGARSCVCCRYCYYYLNLMALVYA